MNPICFQIGPITIYWFSIMAMLGFLFANIHWSVLARKEGYSTEFGSSLALWMILSGIVGARIAFVIANADLYREAPLTIFRIDQGGIIFYGGLIGASLAVILLATFKKEPIWAVGDLAISALPLGHALGRIGCLMNGCCYGLPTEHAWGVHLHGAIRLPTQLYETFFNLVLYGFLCWMVPRRSKNGSIVVIYLLIYPPARFVIEFFRGDDRQQWLGLHTAQHMSLILFCVGLVLWFALPNRLRRPEKGLGPNPSNHASA
ncbi:MAG: prolipoprotein diacylglyceryl transferase [Kiritimatiellae bacterium]|nr:prolipoprotein diacylglyceryl transferase [Kiritimatiellia bacterium]